jgi:pilus assembly protein Flp/PilA
MRKHRWVRTTLFYAPPRHFLLEESAMRNLLRHARHFLVNEDGPTAVEYAVMLALIIVVCLTAITAIGTNANATFQSVADKLPAGAAS